MMLVLNEIVMRRFDHPGRNPILLRFLPLSPECSALAFFALAISRSNIPCVTLQRSGFGH